MKKVFSYISIGIIASIMVFISVLVFAKKNIPITYAKPYQINVFNHSLSSTILKEEDDKYEKVLHGLNEMTNVSLFNRLKDGGNLKEKIFLDDEGKWTKFNSELKKDNIAVELIFDKEQDLVVWSEGASKVISYFSMMFLIPESNTLDDIIVYYSSENSDQRETYYSKCTPVVLPGDATEVASITKGIIASS